MADRAAPHQTATTDRKVSGIWYLFGSLLQGLGLLLIQPFAIRILDDRQWGLVSTSVVTIQVLVVLISAGLPLAITNTWFALERGPERARAMYGFMVIASGVLAVIGVTFMMIINAIGEGTARPTTLLSIVTVGLLGSVLGSQAILRAQNRPGSFVLLSVGSSVLANLSGLVALIVIAPTAQAYMSAYTAAVAATAVLAWVMASPRRPWRVPGASRESLQIAGPLLPHTGALMLLTQGSVLMLAWTATIEDAGRFGAVLIFALGPITMLNALNNAWATRMMSAGEDAVAEVTKRVSHEAVVWSVSIGLLASAGAAVGSLLLSTEPVYVWPIAVTLPMVSSGYALFLVASNLLYIANRTRALAVATPTVLLIVAGLSFGPATRSDVLLVAILQALGFLLLGVVTYLIISRSMPGRSVPLVLFLSGIAIHIPVVLLLSFVPISLLAGVIEVGCVVLLLAGSLLIRARYVKRRDSLVA